MATPSLQQQPAHSAQAALIEELAHVARLRANRSANPILMGALQRVAMWQSRRLRMTYADLAAQNRYADAISFFETDLYGGMDFAQRDADLARVVPVMVRMLPERVILTIAKAVELHVLSQELDRSLLARLPRADGHFTVAEYCKAYRRMAKRAERERQTQLIGEIGATLDGYVKQPLIRTALLMMRQPARLAGLAALHDFLDRGFGAFRRMNGAAEFLSTIDARERALMEAILAGESAPFSDPLAPQTVRAEQATPASV
jgi:hypothetical protein